MEVEDEPPKLDIEPGEVPQKQDKEKKKGKSTTS